MHTQVKTAVPNNKPTILGKKIKQHYYREDNCLELVLDVASDAVARRITGIALGYATNLVIDMCLLCKAKPRTNSPRKSWRH